MGIPDRLLINTATWQEPGVQTDSRGDDLPDWDNLASERTIRGRLEQVPGGTEALDARDTVVSTLVFFTNELGVSPFARLIIGTLTYQVQGAPNVRGASAPGHHAEIPLRLMEG